jgi:hypothetical protein
LPLRLASAESNQGQDLRVSGGSFTRWPVKGVRAAMVREIGQNTAAHDAPKVWMF